MYLVCSSPLARLGVIKIGYVLAFDIGAENRAGLTCPAGVEVRELRHDEARNLAARREGWFFPQAVDESLSRGDRCFAVLVDGVVACSNWCSVQPLSQFGLLLKPPRDGFFEHRLFTTPEFRGRRLQALLREFVMEVHSAEGYRWYLNTMYSTNSSSLRAAFKLGFRRVGTIILLGPDSWGLKRLINARNPVVEVL